MRRRRILPCVLLLVLVTVGCKPKAKLDPNPLADADPAQGFVSDAFTQSGGALGHGVAQRAFDRDRLALAADPLGAARLALALEAERGCGQSNCTLDSKAITVLSSFTQVTTAETDALSAQAVELERWASLSVAHAALGIANLAQTEGILDAQAKTSIGAAATAFVAAAPSQSFEKVDWTALDASFDPLVRAELESHPPVDQPTAASAAAADAVTAAVVDALDRILGSKPFPALCCSATLAALPLDSAAYQVLRRRRVVSEWRHNLPADTASNYASSLATFAIAAVGNGTVAADWLALDAGASPHLTRMGAALDGIRAGLLIDAPRIKGTVGIPSPTFSDPNASDFQPNVATDPGAIRADPSVSLGTSIDFEFVGFDDIRLILPGRVSPAPTPTPSEALESDGSTSHPTASRIAIAWTVGTAAPLDHLDLRILRRNGSVVLHVIEKPDATGAFPHRTVFDPIAMDSLHPTPAAGSHTNVDYAIEAVAVDFEGRASSVACANASVRFDGAPVSGSAAERHPGNADFPSNACPQFQPELAGFYLAPSTTLSFRSATWDGDTRRVHDPDPVVFAATDLTFTISNNDAGPVHVRSLYSPPWVEFLPVDRSIGGVPELDSGEVPAGSSAGILVGPVDRERAWSVVDVDDPSSSVIDVTAD